MDWILPFVCSKKINQGGATGLKRRLLSGTRNRGSHNLPMRIRCAVKTYLHWIAPMETFCENLFWILLPEIISSLILLPLTAILFSTSHQEDLPISSVMEMPFMPRAEYR